MSAFPSPGDRIRWTNIPPNCKARGDELGTFKSRNGGYLYCEMDGTKSIVELYLCEIEILENK